VLFNHEDLATVNLFPSFPPGLLWSKSHLLEFTTSLELELGTDNLRYRSDDGIRAGC
jgi:hypothetical protein